VGFERDGSLNRVSPLTPGCVTWVWATGGAMWASSAMAPLIGCLHSLLVASCGFGATGGAVWPSSVMPPRNRVSPLPPGYIAWVWG